MFAASLALLAHEFQGAERGFALGVWGAITGAALAIGPVVGGLLVDGLGLALGVPRQPAGRRRPAVADAHAGCPSRATRRRADSTSPAC